MKDKKDVEEREVDADRDVGRGGDKNGSFCFYKHNDRQEQPQQNTQCAKPVLPVHTEDVKHFGQQPLITAAAAVSSCLLHIVMAGSLV